MALKGWWEDLSNGRVNIVGKVCKIQTGKELYAGVVVKIIGNQFITVSSVNEKTYFLNIDHIEAIEVCE